MENITLNVELRQETGKEKIGRLRRAGKVPGIFYGPGKAATAISFDAYEFRRKLEGLEGSHVIQFSSSLAELNEKMALLKEIQRHPVTLKLMHIDFYEVDVNNPIQATVPLHFVGKPEGVTAGGVLQSLRREITVECLPRDLPEFLEVDVTGLKIHDALHIEDLVLPVGVKAVYETNEAVVSVLPPTVVQEAAPAETVEVPEAAAPAGSPAQPESEKK
jgi:large subunit ribosomal protein L25